MKTVLMTALAVLSLGLAPAFGAEGNGEPFPYSAPTSATRSTVMAPQFADVGSAAYPNVTGLPGTDLPRLAGDVLPTNGSESEVQTANSLPRGFEEGTVAYAQANQIRTWMLAHAPRATSPAYASVASPRTYGG